MELTGKVIIFDSEEDAKVWFESINEVIYKGKIESERMKMESWMKKMKEEDK